MAVRNLVDSSYSNDLLRILNPKENEFVVALSTNIDSTDENVLNAVKGFHKVAGSSLEKSVSSFLKNYLRTKGLFYVKSKGYWEGNINNNSYLIMAPREIAEELVSHHDDWFGQDAVLAFGPDCSAELFSIPEDFCTKVDDLWVRFVFDGEVIETAEKKSTPEKEDIALTESSKEDTKIKLDKVLAKLRINTSIEPLIDGNRIRLFAYTDKQAQRWAEKLYSVGYHVKDYYETGAYIVEFVIDDRDLTTEATLPEESETIKMGGRTVAKKGSSNTEVPRGSINKNEKWTEETVAEETYKVAPRVYNKHHNLKDLGYHRDDFIQDAVIYILDLFNRQYFPLDSDNIQPMIYRMLDGFFVINKEKELQTLKSREELSLDKTIKYGDPANPGERTEKDRIQDTQNSDPSELEELSRGKDVLEELVDKEFSVVAYASKKHSYEFTEGNLKGQKLSEAAIAKLIISGKSLQAILKMLGMNITNAGSDSKASFVAHKVSDTINKLADLINNLPDKKRELVKLYMRGQMKD